MQFTGMPTLPTRPVELGFSAEAHPGTWLSPHAPLGLDSDYFFGFEVGKWKASAGAPQTSARLKVAVFGFSGELRIFPGADVGEIELQDDGSSRVAQPASLPPGIAEDSPTLARRLFFRVTTPAGPLRARLRCNVYHGHTLVQSWLVQTQVGQPAGEPVSFLQRLRSLVRPPAATRWVPDYLLSRTLDPASLRALGTHRLSVMLNASGQGTHNLRFFGGDGTELFKHETELDAALAQSLVQQARGALRLASWGSDRDWQAEPYRYATPSGRPHLAADLIKLAIRGYRMYDTIIDPLTGGAAERLGEMMRTPGQVQIALASSARLVLPAALLYDYPLDTGLRESDLRLCSAFEAALNDSVPLELTECFQGECPSLQEPDALSIVCPSGFWGFRHALGLPLSTEFVPDTPAEIVSQGGPTIAVSVSTDQAFTLRADHERELEMLRPDLTYVYADRRDATFKVLKEAHAHLVYFYCHGGFNKDSQVPYIQVGPPTERGIVPDNLRAQKIRWTSPRPLVFVNGCRTTALEPEQALEFVTAFVGRAAAAGVMGTEITIFEPLARAFAEDCLGRFLQGVPLGEAVRLTRLALLKAGNPLGLVYIPFALPGLRLTIPTERVFEDFDRRLGRAGTRAGVAPGS